MITSVMMEMPGSDEWFMRQAMKESRKALVKGEVPVGAIVVKDGRVIGRGWNQVETLKDATAHAEMIALTAAQEALGDWRLEGCTMYITLEPCQMCAGAIVQARVSRVVIGSMNPKAGCAGSVLNLLEVEGFNHQVKTTRGVLQEECSTMLSDFFRELREKKKQRKMLAKQEAQQMQEQKTEEQ